MKWILCFIGIHQEIIVEQFADEELGIYKYYSYCFYCNRRIGQPLHGQRLISQYDMKSNETCDHKDCKNKAKLKCSEELHYFCKKHGEKYEDCPACEPSYLEEI